MLASGRVLRWTTDESQGPATVFLGVSLVAGGWRRASERLVWARFRRDLVWLGGDGRYLRSGHLRRGLPASLFGVRLLVGAGD